MHCLIIMCGFERVQSHVCLLVVLDLRCTTNRSRMTLMRKILAVLLLVVVLVRRARRLRRMANVKALLLTLLMSRYVA
jgi:hypothetical protein